MLSLMIVSIYASSMPLFDLNKPAFLQNSPKYHSIQGNQTSEFIESWCRFDEGRQRLTAASALLEVATPTVSPISNKTTLYFKANFDIRTSEKWKIRKGDMIALASATPISSSAVNVVIYSIKDRKSASFKIAVRNNSNVNSKRQFWLREHIAQWFDQTKIAHRFPERKLSADLIITDICDTYLPL
jgi:hypothetical protein